MNNYRVSSDFGEFNISSTSLLKIRLTEIEAMAKMREVEEDDSTEQAMQDIVAFLNAQ